MDNWRGEWRITTLVCSRYLAARPAEFAGPFLRTDGITMGHGLIAWIIIGIIAGWITGKLMSGGGYGAIMDMIVGLLGALAGGFLMSHLFGASATGGWIYSIIVAVIGAVLLTLILRLVTRGSTRNI